MNANLLPADLMSRAAGLQSAIRRNRKLAPTKHKADTIERYEKLRPIIEPLVQAGATQWAIAHALGGLGILTPDGKVYWTQKGVARALTVLRLRTKGQVNLGVGAV